MIASRILLIAIVLGNSAAFGMDKSIQLYVDTDHNQLHCNNGYHMNMRGDLYVNPYLADMNSYMMYGRFETKFYNSPDVASNMAVLKARRQQVINNVLEMVANNDIPGFEFYYSNGGNINVKGDLCGNDLYLKRVTPLMLTAFCGRPKIMKILIDTEEVELDTQDDLFGDTALIRAAKAGWASLVRLLLKAGAKPDIRNKAGRTALDEAYNSPLRGHDYYETGSKNHRFAEMIKYLEKAQKKNNAQKDNTAHYYLTYH